MILTYVLPSATPNPVTNKLKSFASLQIKRIDDAERRARDILRFSPLMTDAYFHYTPSQIMMAALSLADRGLAERLIQATFHYVNPQTDSGADTPSADAKDSNRKTEDKAAIIGSYIRDKVLGTIESCRDMLHKELPERREHWIDVCFSAQPLSPHLTSPLLSSPSFPSISPQTNHHLPNYRRKSTKPTTNPSGRNSTSATTQTGGTWSSCKSHDGNRP